MSVHEELLSRDVLSGRNSVYSILSDLGKDLGWMADL